MIIIRMFFFAAIGFTLSFSQSFNAISQHPVSLFDSSTLEGIPVDSLDEMLSAYSELIEDCIEEGYSFYPCENRLYNQLLYKNTELTNKQQRYVCSISQVCFNMQKDLKLQDDSLIKTINMLNNGVVTTQSCWEDVVDDMDGIDDSYTSFTRQNRPVLFVREHKKPLPFYWLSTGLYPVGLLLVGTGIHGLIKLNSENYEGIGLLYFFDLVVMIAGVAPIAGATITMVKYAKNKKKFREYQTIVNNYRHCDTIRTILVKRRWGRTILTE